MSAHADVVFNFNSLSPGTGNTANENAIASYMDGLLNCANCVTVTGAATNQTYNGDGHVVGPNGVSLTLGTSDGATSNSSTTPSQTYDTFLSNVTNVAGPDHNQTQSISDEIIITFSQAVTLKGFDYEIFPDDSCSDQWHCGEHMSNLPDFTFDINGSTQIFNTNAVFPANPGSNGNSTESPDSDFEQAAQYIGHWSGNLTNVTQLDFIDWPAAIGVDNIAIASPVPEPRDGAFLLSGLLIAALGGRKLLAFAKS